jgi:hypothetical protein
MYSLTDSDMSFGKWTQTGYSDNPEKSGFGNYVGGS